MRVLEANDRVGGRTVNLPLPGGKITEGGGQWTGPGQDRVQALARELGIGMFDTYVTGESVYVYQGNRQTHTGTLPPLGPAALVISSGSLTRLDQMASTVPLDAPWQAAERRAVGRDDVWPVAGCERGHSGGEIAVHARVFDHQWPGPARHLVVVRAVRDPLRRRDRRV